jgi:disulfide bond formation protein DsbB
MYTAVMFTDFTSTFVTGLSAFTVLGQAIFVTLGALFLLKNAPIVRWVRKHALWLMLVVSLVATGSSLYFSEIAGWTPCLLCWYQRIFMYPQVLVLAYAVWKRDKTVAPYIFLLCVCGSAIAAYHYWEQLQHVLWPAMELEPCDATGTSCARTPFFHFGYITIPMMALTAFLLNALGSLIIVRSKA